MKSKREGAVIYTVGSMGYSLLEMLWRGYTNWTMTLAGGVCLSLLYRLAHAMRGISLWKQALVGGAVISAVELVAGWLFNLKLGLKVWDYSHFPFNLKGQICLLYSVLWCLLCVVVMPLCTLLGRRLHN